MPSVSLIDASEGSEGSKESEGSEGSEESGDGGVGLWLGEEVRVVMGVVTGLSFNSLLTVFVIWCNLMALVAY